MNTGIQYCHNLAWKLAHVLAGHAGPALLDTYQPERRAAATISVALSRELHCGYRTLGGDAPTQLYERIAPDYLRAMLRYRYRSSAVIPEADHTDTVTSVLSDSLAPGYRRARLHD